MNPYCLGIDVWEGSMDVDEEILKNAGIKFMIIRINDMDGGLHRDKNFENQWAQARNFIRWPYFVYSPWADQRTNFNFLCDIMPADATHVSLDIEVVRNGYAKSEYTRQVNGFFNLVAERWSCDIYTGHWFIPLLEKWPTHIPYWMARYPYAFYPANSEVITWDEIRAKIAAFPWSPGNTPGPCRLWQISGDRYKPEGCAGRVIDVNVWNGTEEELRAYVGSPEPKPEWRKEITTWARSQPDPYKGPDPE